MVGGEEVGEVDYLLKVGCQVQVPVVSWRRQDKGKGISLTQLVRFRLANVCECESKPLAWHFASTVCSTCTVCTVCTACAVYNAWIACTVCTT